VERERKEGGETGAQLVRELRKVAESGWGVTTRVVFLCAAMAVVAVAFSFVGLFRVV
jgi:neutral trehalase